MLEVHFSGVSHELGRFGGSDTEMSGQPVPADFSGHMLDLDEDEDLEVFSKVPTESPEKSRELRTPVLTLNPTGFLCYVDLCRALERNSVESCVKLT